MYFLVFLITSIYCAYELYKEKQTGQAKNGNNEHKSTTNDNMRDETAQMDRIRYFIKKINTHNKTASQPITTVEMGKFLRRKHHSITIIQQAFNEKAVDDKENKGTR